MIEIGKDTGIKKGKLDKSEEKKVLSEKRNEGQAKTEEKGEGKLDNREGKRKRFMKEENGDVGKTSFLVWIRLTSWLRNEISEREGLM